MIRTQIMLPDGLYQTAKEYGNARELSLAETVRRALELLFSVTPTAEKGAEWKFPVAKGVGKTLCDPFENPDWREEFCRAEERIVAEDGDDYDAGGKGK